MLEVYPSALNWGTPFPPASILAVNIASLRSATTRFPALCGRLCATMICSTWHLTRAGAIGPTGQLKARASEADDGTAVLARAMRTMLDRPIPMRLMEDNEAAPRIFVSGRNPAVRHMGRTYRVYIACLHEVLKSPLRRCAHPPHGCRYIYEGIELCRKVGFGLYLDWYIPPGCAAMDGMSCSDAVMARPLTCTLCRDLFLNSAALPAVFSVALPSITRCVRSSVSLSRLLTSPPSGESSFINTARAITQ